MITDSRVVFTLFYVFRNISSHAAFVHSTSLFADYLCSRTQHDQHEFYKQYTIAMAPPAAREAITPESGYVAEYF